MAWHTVVGGSAGQTDTTALLVAGPGTVRRLIVDVLGGHASAGVEAAASFHWIIAVGVAAADPNVFGLDPETTMLHGAGLIPNPATIPLTTTAPAISLDSDGDRVIAAGESLWLRLRGGAPPTDWLFLWSIRVLLT